MVHSLPRRRRHPAISAAAPEEMAVAQKEHVDAAADGVHDVAESERLVHVESGELVVAEPVAGRVMQFHQPQA